MICRSRAPLRIGLAGGGTDVSPYCDLYGGAILNATIDRYAYATLIPRDDGQIVFSSLDRGDRESAPVASELPTTGPLALLKGVYNRVVREFSVKPFAFELATHVDAPAGSGLGTSSTLVVAALGAFVEWSRLPLGEYDAARIAFNVERVDLGMAGGRQDQYAATFGGFNFMEFFPDDKVIVNPLRVKDDYVNELDHNLVLYNTGTSRLSAKIIDAQTANVKKNTETVDAMHNLKAQAYQMKEALLQGRLNEIGRILDFGWQHKKGLAAGVTNPAIDELYRAALEAGATGGKISGAGGGGFMMFYCPENTRYAVARKLEEFGGIVTSFRFTNVGLTTWRVA